MIGTQLFYFAATIACRLIVADRAMGYNRRAKMGLLPRTACRPGLNTESEPLTRLSPFGGSDNLLNYCHTCDILHYHHYSCRSFPSPCNLSSLERAGAASAALASLSWCHVAMENLSGRLLLLSLRCIGFRPFQAVAKDPPRSSLTLAHKLTHPGSMQSDL